MGYNLLFQQAIKLHETGELSKAEQIYRQILETTPNNADVLNLLGLIAQSKGLHAQACNWFYQAIKSSPTSAMYYFNLGLSLFNDNKPHEAIDAYQKAITLQPETKETYNYLAEVYKHLNDNYKAEEYYKKALTIDNNYIEAKINLAYLQKQIPLLQQIIAENPNEAMAIYYLSRLLRNQNKNMEAYKLLKDYSLAVYDIQLALGELSLSFNKLEAEQYFQNALELNPYSVISLINLGNFATSKKDFTSAEKLYKRAIELDNNNFEAHANYANLLTLLNRKSEALEEYRQAIIIDNTRPEISNNLGLILKDEQEYTEALGLFFNAFTKNPQQEEYSINIAETLTLLYYKDEETAKKIASNWVKQNSNNPFAQHINSAFNGELSENNQIYTQMLFEHFADNYELVLANIGYALPRKFRRITNDVEGLIVDLGCGTGLIGVAYKTNFNRFIGVDISKKMLEKAEQKQCYQRLECEDIITFCQREIQTLKPNLITVADVCCYIRDLEPLIKVCHPYPMIFSIETLSNVTETCSLQPNGRYTHNPTHIAEILAKYYGTIQQETTILRKENGQDVSGIIFYAK